MSAMKGYYSVIQYCPDRSRMEAANIGVLLLCPDLGFVKARTVVGNDRVAKFFGRESFDRTRIKAAKRSIERRVEVDRGSFRTPEDLVRFMDTRGNDILLTPPRPVKVEDPETDLDALFQELVGGRSRHRREEPEIPALDQAFRRPALQARVVFNPLVVVPVVGRALKVPYAFRNGVLNLVKPQRFVSEDKRATGTAMQLAIEGDLLYTHSEAGEQRKLIVVSAFPDAESVRDLRARVDNVLGKYNVRVVHEDQIEEFAAEVEHETHA
jgi:hypothetical protein